MIFAFKLMSSIIQQSKIFSPYLTGIYPIPIGILTSKIATKTCVLTVK